MVILIIAEAPGKIKETEDSQKNRNHPDESTAEMGENTEESPGELKRIHK